MANLEIEGRLVRKLDVQSGRSARGDWSKQEFIVEYQEGSFPSSVCFNVWGADKVRDLERFQTGDEIRVSFNPSSREYNGRWYTDIRAWRLQNVQPEAPAAAAPMPDLPPFGEEPSYSAPASNAAAGIEEDVPF